MPQKTKDMSQEHVQATKDLSARISGVVTKALLTSNRRRSWLTANTGLQRSTLSEILNPAVPDRKWTLENIVAVSRAFRVPVYQMIQAAETGTPLARKVIPLDERIAALEKELEVLRKKQRRRNITKLMTELSEQWSALKQEAEQLDSEDEDPLGLYEN
jgi:hypothetical protein